MKDIYLMRHGETIFNQKLMLQGCCDAPLTSLGINQAKKAHQYFVDHHINFDYVIASPSPRALQTAQIVSTKLPDGVSRYLHEWYFGLLEGENQKLFPQSFPYHDAFVPFQGESQHDVEARINHGLTLINNNLPENTTTLIVSHTCVIRLFMKQHKKDSNIPLPLKINNCGILHYQVDNNIWKLVEVIEHEF